MFKMKTVLALAALTAGAFAAQAMAQPDAPSITINYSGLNLSSSADVQLLYRRLKQAAGDVCGNADPRELARYMRFKACYNSALERAVNQVNSPQLLALHRSAAMRPTAWVMS